MNARLTLSFEDGPTLRRDFLHYESELTLRQDMDAWETSTVKYYPEWTYEREETIEE